VPDGQVVFEISADGKKAIASINDVTNAIEQAGKKWDGAAGQSTQSIESKFTGMLTKIGAAFSAAKIGQALLDFGNDAIALASDLQEVQNVVDVTFGDGAAQIESWAKSAQSQFGLTEIQAKRFTSTLGAMMKSSGLAGPEIVNMSTDLAGLAADMASFYNLDFDTAFQKIRSGISGETEPLKQLGINMSVANLEAYALTQGITKAFDQMSQGEQTMLRYQYLMQATADAQGDFARTADGYANSQRRIQTAIDSIKTSAGTLLMDVIEPVTSGIADMLLELTKVPERTVLDEISDVGKDATKKTAEIEATAQKARELVNVLNEIDASGLTTAASAVDTFSQKAKALDGSEQEQWSTLLNTLNGADTTKGVFGENAAERITAMSEALTSNDPAKKKAAWEEITSVLRENASAIGELTGKNPEEVAAMLKRMEEATPETGENLEAWKALLGGLVGDFDSLGKEGLGEDFITQLEELGKKEGENSFFSQLAQGFRELSSNSGEAGRALQALGIDTDGVEDSQTLWLRTCQELVKTIPGLSEIIDTNTGHIEGGTQAVLDYIKAWQQYSTASVMWEAHRQKGQIIQNAFSDLTGLHLDVINAEANHRDRINRAKELAKSMGFADVPTAVTELMRASFGGLLKDYGTSEAKELLNIWNDSESGVKAWAQAADEYGKRTQEYRKAVDEWEREGENLTEVYGEESEAANKSADAAKQAAEANQELARSEKEVQDAYKSATSALEEVQKYYQKTVDSVRSTLQGLGGAFGAIETPTQQAQKNIKDLQDQLAKAKKDSEKDSIKLKLEGAGEAIQSITKMQTALDQQLSYFQNYSKMLERARELGYSDEVLSSVSDGSAQSYDYLTALTDSSITKDDERIKQLNESYQAVAAEREKLSGQLADQQLKTDQAFQGLVDSATEAINNLNLDEEASNAMAATVQGIANGIQSKIGAVQAQVNALNKVLSQIGSTGKFGFVNNRLSFGGFNFKLDGVHASGIDYIPFNNYLAALHEGESVLTAEEAKIWRNFKYGGAGVRNTIDYDALGASVGANVKGGGNVYLDGQTVGRVISARQADSFRAMERSGFQQ
jgi:hypothetical protein